MAPRFVGPGSIDAARMRSTAALVPDARVQPDERLVIDDPSRLGDFQCVLQLVPEQGDGGFVVNAGIEVDPQVPLASRRRHELRFAARPTIEQPALFDVNDDVRTLECIDENRQSGRHCVPALKQRDYPAAQGPNPWRHQVCPPGTRPGDDQECARAQRAMRSNVKTHAPTIAGRCDVSATVMRNRRITRLLRYKNIAAG